MGPVITSEHKIRRHRLAGILILFMISMTVLSGLGLISTTFDIYAGFAAWLAALLLFADTSSVLKIQVSAILLTGIACMGFADQRTAAIDFDLVISSGTGLVTMIAAVGFLRLVVIADPAHKESLPRGHKSFLQTILGLNISSSMINISAPILITDQIHRHRPIERFTAQTFTRVFCGVSSWSPFFGAMAVVLTYVDGASLLWLMAAGLPFTLFGISAVYFEARLRYAAEVADFIGYPAHLSALQVPLILILVVIASAQLLPRVPILVIIAIAALAVTTSLLCKKYGITGAYSRLQQHVTQGLAQIVNELCLFLAAGVLAAGISALITQGVFENPFHHFDADIAILVLALMLACAMCGIHPIIMISSFAPMLLTLNPNPNLLAVTFLFAWHLGTCSNPLSGTNLVFQGRYGIPGWKIAYWNWPYAALMLIVGALWLQFIAPILP